MADKRLMIYVLPLFLLLIIAEIIIYKKRGLRFPYQEAVVSVAMTVIFQVVMRAQKPILDAINASVFEFSLFEIQMDQLWHWVGLFFLVEFFYYWQHRSMHGIRWLWASHQVHHSPENITLSGAYRLAITQVLSLVFIFFLPIYLLGFHPVDVAIVYSINLFYQFWLHTELVPKLGWFEYIFNTPSHHRVHHAVNPIYIDKNHGGVLIIFDRIFGTFQEEKAEEPCRYGLVGKTASNNPLKIFFQEWASILRNLKECKNLTDVYYATLAAPGEFRKHMDSKMDEITKLAS